MGVQSLRCRMPWDDNQLTCKRELERIRDVLGKLREYAFEESELADRRAIIAELEGQAIQLLSGDTDVRSMNLTGGLRVPGREVAKKVIALASQLPAIDVEVDEPSRLGIARLYENLVVGVTGVIMRDFPDLIPRYDS